ncbi:glycoside hydrolase family 3 protein [Saccharata proteae CBS 121410]|uniref:Probable beta-glucosidase G n=1 Tax=Saccharata proteae CBS 121410 TaxID=1314787 RepID=A0A6A5YE02_9PEZI|nr:glycoside hydrolase family 3 protein [Saccharata proteae CBS 121410]
MLIGFFLANITGAGGWEDALVKAKGFLAEMTLEEKAWMVTGSIGPCSGSIASIPRLNFTGLCLQDGPLAIRQAILASVFPAGLTAASSWDRDLINKRGVYLGEEFKAKGAHLGLGPVCGPLGRSPYGGRNWEGFSSDPYLTGVAIEETITGWQSAGTQACVKHFVSNEQETQRNPTTAEDGTTILSVSSNVDDRTMHELYLWPFANAVRAGTASVMCSYNRLNQTYTCENSKALNGWLKGELGFQGYVMSDWQASHSGVPAIEAGQDMNMPGGIYSTSSTPSFWGENITMAIQNGSLAESRLDDMILRILTPYYHLGQDQDFPSIDTSSAAMTDQSTWEFNYTLGPMVDVRSDEHTKLIRDLAAQGTILLKNTNNTLPLKAPTSIGVFGNDAGEVTDGLTTFVNNTFKDFSYNDGTVAVGGGSGTGRLSYLVTPFDAIKARAAQDGAMLQYILNNNVITDPTIGLGSLAPTPPEVCLVFIKSWATENYDRVSLLADSNGTAVVDAVAAVCPNTIVIHHGTGPVLYPFANHPNVTAILETHLPGQESGNSLVDVLYGTVNPSGHLPYTIPVSAAAVPLRIVNSTTLINTTDPNAWQDDYSENLLIDYRYYDTTNRSADVLYPFGHGLSYTTFALSNLTTVPATSDPITALPPTSQILPGGNTALWDTLFNVTATVTNTGSVAGAAVPQLYVDLAGAGAPAGTPRNQLRGFDKVWLEKGESKTVDFPLMRRDVSFWDTGSQQWRVPGGAIGVAVGWSVGDLVVSGSVGI